MADQALGSIVRSLSVHDYCNSLLTGVNGGLLQRLQSVQNAAARLKLPARGDVNTSRRY